MRIAHLITSLGGGGTENFLHQILQRSPQGITHDVYFLKDDGIIGERIRALGIPARRVAGFNGCVSALRSNRPDVLHTLLYRAHQVGRLAGRLSHVPIILSSQRAIDAWQKPWHALIDAATLRFCRAVLANSDAACHLVSARRPPGPDFDIRKLPNGIDAARAAALDRTQARRKLGWPQDARIGGSLMRLHAEKGADRIPPFAEALLTRHPDLTLAVGGVGPLETALREKTANRPWSSRLLWVGWQEDPFLFLSALDFFWLLSREESFPQSLLEASAAGLPWIAPAVGDTSTLAAAAEGKTFPAESGPAASIAMCEHLFSELPERKNRALAAAPAIRQTYSVEQTAALFYGFVKRLSLPCEPAGQRL